MDNGTTVADIATEVAAEATARGQHIQQETQKLTKKVELYVPNQNDHRLSLSGGVMQDPEADVQDIRKRSVHKLDTSDRLPWLKGLGSDIQPRIDEDDERTHQDQERLTSPDSGVMDHLSEATESLEDNALSVTSIPHLTSKSQKQVEDTTILLPPESYRFEAPSHLQNGELSATELPLRDYPILPPPKDYPNLEQQPVATSNLAGDAYTVQEAKLNSRPVKAKTKTHQSGASASPIHSHQIYS